ncbi:MAG: DUF4188 domain-containing protein [Isosphaeraceae bacterium]
MPTLIQRRMAAALEGEFVVFLIGMRVNRPWKVHKWLPIALAMRRMLRDLTTRPESGLLGFQVYRGGRNRLVVQYWRSFEHLERFAHDPARDHVPAWLDFNRSVGSSGDVGIWHETYRVAAGQYEAIYHNMPPHGLGAVGPLVPASGRHATAAGRLGLRERDDAPIDPAGAIHRS